MITIGIPSLAAAALFTGGLPYFPPPYGPRLPNPNLLPDSTDTIKIPRLIRWPDHDATWFKHLVYWHDRNAVKLLDDIKAFSFINRDHEILHRVKVAFPDGSWTLFFIIDYLCPELTGRIIKPNGQVVK
jgi:hypothetical protein